ncbi:MAG: autophagy protein atg9 [Cirrosporium novae-zelandiae]|nr:MAG: autophagy protein atg9 [Cirrosporium novae-zelandiae]
MMASNLLSRLLPSAGPPSVYENLHHHDQESDTSDPEERAGMALDEENLGHPFQDYELEDVLEDDPAESQMTTASTILPGRNNNKDSGFRNTGGRSRLGRSMKPRWMHESTRIPEADEGDDDVPASLLIEGHRRASLSAKPPRPRANDRRSTSFPIPGPPTAAARSHWATTQNQQALHPDDPDIQRRPQGGWTAMDLKERALWRWANVDNLDMFLKEIYDYFLGKGFWSILLGRALNLLTFAFVVSFSFFLTMCIDYPAVPHSKSMSGIIRDKCTTEMSFMASLFLWILTFTWIFRVVEYIRDIPRLRHLHDFYVYLLEIPENDMQTVSWQEIVGRVMRLRDSNPITATAMSKKHRNFIDRRSKQRMDAHDIANRLMRKENYLIAMFNKEILDLTIPIPFLRNQQYFSRVMEWNLHMSVLDFVFNDKGQVRSYFLKDSHRHELSTSLQRRFRFTAFMNVVFAPFIITYFVLLYFFRYFTEYQRNPSQIGLRKYTPLAEWKFREFNELWHLFERRINMSYPFASRYIDQFPKDKTIQLSRFVALVAGALAGVLALASLIDPELFLGFEITKDRTVLFYLGVLTSIWVGARGIVPEENLVFDPEFALREVVEYTHHCPDHWQGRLHTDEVRKEFASLYQMKLVIFLEEMLSVVMCPLILWYSLPKCSDRIVDFFREFTVHVDGLGYVCSFAVFDFQTGGNKKSRPQEQRSGPDGRDDYFATRDGKMLASYYGFIDNYATNPRKNAPYHHPTNKKMFHPPPTFPGLMSPTLNAERDGTYGRNQRSGNRSSPIGGTFGQQSVVRTPKFAPSGNHGSPLGSMLLDPHHQPSIRSMGKSRHRSSQPLDDQIEAEEENEQDGVEATTTSGVASAGTDGPESHLGGSWKTTQAAVVDDEDADEADNNAGGNRGVLGLIFDFQRAQTEGRAVNI